MGNDPITDELRAWGRANVRVAERAGVSFAAATVRWLTRVLRQGTALVNTKDLIRLREAIEERLQAKKNGGGDGK